MLCGSPPFNGANDKDIMQKVQIGKYSFEAEEWDRVSKGAKTFISQLLEQDVSKRLSAEEALQNEWVTTYSRKEINLPSLTKCLRNMQNFSVQLKLQEACLMFMVNYLASKDEKNEAIL